MTSSAARQDARRTLDPQDWAELRALAHRAVDEIYAEWLEYVRLRGELAGG